MALALQGEGGVLLRVCAKKGFSPSPRKSDEDDNLLFDGYRQFLMGGANPCPTIGRSGIDIDGRLETGKAGD